MVPEENDDARRRWNDLLPVQTFWQMKAQLDSQDRELSALKTDVKDIKSDISKILETVNKSKGGWSVLIIAGSVGGFIIDLVVRKMWGA